MSKTIIIRCNLCGKELDEVDRNLHFSMHRRIGYGSKHDGELLDLDICGKCMDAIIDQAEVSPISECGEEDLWF